MLEGLDFNSQSKIIFLDPNPLNKTNVASFGSRNNPQTVNAYGVIQSHLKLMYSKQNVRNKFYDYFMNTRTESKKVMLSKFHKTLTYSSPKQLRFNASTTAGVAQIGANWFSVNWPLTHYVNGE